MVKHALAAIQLNRSWVNLHQHSNSVYANNNDFQDCTHVQGPGNILFVKAISNKFSCASQLSNHVTSVDESYFLLIMVNLPAS